MFKTTSKDIDLQNIVKINNTVELSDFIWNFIQENSKENHDKVENSQLLLSPSSITGVQSRPEKVSLDSLGTIKQRLSHFISTSANPVPVPKSLRDGLETEDDVSHTISKIIAAEQDNIYETIDEEENLQEQLKIIQEHFEDNNSESAVTYDDKLYDYYNSEPPQQSTDNLSDSDYYEETPSLIVPENNVQWTSADSEDTNNEASMSYYEYTDELDANDSGSKPNPSLVYPPQIVASNALTSLNDLFKKHLAHTGTSNGHNGLLPLDIIEKLQQSPDTVPESETLNIILTPGGKNKAHPNIAILPTDQLDDFSSNISGDIGVDIEAILSSLAGSASKIKNQPMIVEENHTQLIKQPGQPTKLKIKETMSEILGDSLNPKINILSNKEEEGSFQDLQSLIKQVAGEVAPQFPQKTDMPKSQLTLDDQLKLNVSTRTNIVNIFAFNIYPSGAPMTSDSKYQINDFSSLGTSINTQANVLFQPPGMAPTHIESHYDFQSQPTPKPSSKKNTIDKILGAVLLSQLEGGGSDRVIEALGQNPDIMTQMYENQKNNAPVARPTTQPVSLGLYPEGIDNLSEYSPGPYGTIARNSAIEKLISAMTQAEQGSINQQNLQSVMDEMPDYAKLLLGGSQTRKRSESSGPLGPLGYSVKQDTNKNSNTKNKINRKNPKDILESMGGSGLAAIMAGAVVTYPYWLPLLAGKKKRKKRFAPRTSRIGNPEISNDWLALLIGSKYISSDNIDKRLNTWVTQKTVEPETTSSKMKEDDIFSKLNIKEKVRGGVSKTDSNKIQKWRDNYIQKNKNEPELQSNYYPYKESTTTTTTTKTTTTRSTTTTTTKTTTTTTTTTTATTTTTTITTTSTTKSTTTTISTKTSTKWSTSTESLMFWTTTKPKFGKSQSKNKHRNKIESSFSTTKLTTPASGFMWFTKEPIYKLETSTAQSAWWKGKPSKVIKLSGIIGSEGKKVIKPTLKPNFNNEYQYTQPITRTPADKFNWNERFKPVKATPLFETEIILEAPLIITNENANDDKLKIDEADVAPMSSTLTNTKKVTDKAKVVQKEIDLPKWPYVENLWNKVDKIMDDLLEPSDPQKNKISDLGNVITSLELNTTELKAIDNEALYNSLNPVTTTTKRPDQKYWQGLKKKYGFISAYTEHYEEKPTENPTVTNYPPYYNAKLPDVLLESLYEEPSLVTPAQTIDSSNNLFFESVNQPPSQPYANNPSILIAKRNISSTNDVLGYLGELMKGNKNELQPQNTMDSGTTSTMRSFFKPDLLPDISYSDLKKLNTLQESLGYNDKVKTNYQVFKLVKQPAYASPVPTNKIKIPTFDIPIQCIKGDFWGLF